MPSSKEWAAGFARQARTDFDAYRILSDPSCPVRLRLCHQLHFLQMACEKLAKANFLLSGSTIEEMEKSHVFVAKGLHQIIEKQLLDEGKPPSLIRGIKQSCRHIGREIDALSPSGKRADNCEYPWPAPDGVKVPCEWPFDSLRLLETPHGVGILKRISEAINSHLS